MISSDRVHYSTHTVITDHHVKNYRNNYNAEPLSKNGGRVMPYIRDWNGKPILGDNHCPHLYKNVLNEQDSTSRGTQLYWVNLIPFDDELRHRWRPTKQRVLFPMCSSMALFHYLCNFHGRTIVKSIILAVSLSLSQLFATIDAIKFLVSSSTCGKTATTEKLFVVELVKVRYLWRTLTCDLGFSLVGVVVWWIIPIINWRRQPQYLYKYISRRNTST